MAASGKARPPTMGARWLPAASLTEQESQATRRGAAGGRLWAAAGRGARPLARAGSAAGLARSPAVRAGTRQLPPAKCTGTAAGLGRNPVSGLAHASAAAGVASRPTTTGGTRGLAAIAVER